MASQPQPRPDAEDDARLAAAFNTIPLFMHSLPADDSANDTLAALQSLAYEGTPDEIAQNFKEQGNDYYKGRRWREALGFYTQGVDAQPTDAVLLEALLCNRAACNLELKNFGAVLRDCSRAITLNPRSAKAHYRSGLALLALDRVDDALDVCDRCLAFDAGNVGVRALRDRVLARQDAKAAKERERAERIRKEQAEAQALKAAFAERNLIEVPNPQGTANPYAPYFDPEDPARRTLVLPVFFLYPEYATSDAVPHFVEDTPFAAHIATMFPPAAPAPAWDAAGTYVDGNLVVYAMTRRRRLLKVGKNMTLREVCRAARAREGEPRDGLELKDGCLTFVVLPKGEVERKWVEEFKSGREA